VTWPTVPLGSVADVQLGKMLSPKARTGVSSFPYLRNVNVQWGRLDLLDLVEMDFDEEAQAKFSLKQGDLLVCEGGEPGRSAVVEKDLPGVFFQKALMRVRPRDRRLDTGFLQRFMEYAARRGTFAKDGNQATIAHFPAVKLNALEVPLPPLPEQRRIADILDKANAIRRKRKETIALTEELLRSAFLEMFGDPVTNPKGWEVKPLGEVADVLGGGTPSRARADFFEGTIPWATAKDFKSDVMSTTQEHVTQAAVESSATRLVQPGTVLVVVKSKILMRRLPVSVARVALCFNQDVKGIVAHTPNESSYIATHLRMAQRTLLELARGVNTEGLTVNHLKAHALMRPPLKLVAKFVEFELHIRAGLERGKRALEQSEQLFDSLVHRAFSGEALS
jgi:type I restriction enzyme S subunit